MHRINIFIIVLLTLPIDILHSLFLILKNKDGRHIVVALDIKEFLFIYPFSLGIDIGKVYHDYIACCIISSETIWYIVYIS